jgi:hypothetical protein
MSFLANGQLALGATVVVVLVLVLVLVLGPFLSEQKN